MKLYISFLALFLFALTVQSQFELPYDSLRVNPMSRMSMNTIIGSNDQMVVFEYNGGIRLFCGLNQASDSIGTDQFAPLTTNMFEVTGYISGNFPRISAVAADLNGDKHDELLYAYSNEWNGVTVVAYSFSALSGQTISANLLGTWSTDDNARRQQNVDCSNCRSENGKIELHSVQLNTSSELEQVVMSYYNGADDRVHHDFFGLTGVGDFTHFGSFISSSTVDISSTPLACSINVEPWDVAFDDFNLDGKHEMVFLARPGVPSNYTDINASIVSVLEMSLDNSNVISVSEQSSLTLAMPTGATNHLVKPELSVGDLNGDQIPEIVVADLFGKVSANGANCFNDDDRCAIQVVQVGSLIPSTNSIGALNPVTASPVYISTVYGSSGMQNPVTATTKFRNSELMIADYNGDRMDDLIFSDNLSTRVMPGSDSLLVGSGSTFLNALNAALPYGVNSNTSFLSSKQLSTVSLTDANVDGTAEYFKLENRAAPEGTQRLLLKRLHFSTSQPFDSLVWAIAQQPLQSGLYCAIASGDISGDGYELGKPIHSTFENLEQPVIVLGAPPLHSDLFNGGFSSVVNCLPSCSDWTTSYTTQNTITNQVKTEVHSTWDIGTSVQGTYSAFFGLLKVKSKFESSYGEGYESMTTRTTQLINSSNNYTQFDDAILVSKTTYDVTEYPILKGGQVVSYSISLRPVGQPFSTWTSSKAYDAYGYIPTHEVGNVLSYRRILGPPNIDQNDYAGSLNNVTSIQGQTISPTLAGNWSVTSLNGLENQNSTSWDASVSNSTNIDILFRASVGISGSYNWGGVSTHSSTVTSSFTLSSSTSYTTNNELAYSLRPFVYFGFDGPVGVGWNTSVPVGSGTYWSQYNQQDPGWNMPWRLDVERGFAQNYTENKQRTKSLWLTEYKENTSSEQIETAGSTDYRLSNPVPGQRVVVHARVFNLGLEETLPVPVQFYHGHPNLASGNEPLQDIISGFTAVECPPIPPQEYREVTFTIELPQNLNDPSWLERGPRLYAVIDPQNEITDEVHEENNIAWLSLGQSSIWGEVADSTMLLSQPTGTEEYLSSLEQGLFILSPNPTSKEGILNVQVLSGTGNSTLMITDLSGRVVMSKTISPAGREAIHCSQFSQGMYIARLCNGEKQQSMKFIIE